MPRRSLLMLLALCVGLSRALLGCGKVDDSCGAQCLGAGGVAEQGGRGDGVAGVAGVAGAAGVGAAGAGADAGVGAESGAGAGGAESADGVIRIEPSALPYAALNKPYSVQLLASAGSESGYVFSVAPGTLPDQISLSAAGTLSGLPNQEGVFSFEVRVTDSAGNSGQARFSLHVALHRWLAYSIAPSPYPTAAFSLLDMSTPGYPVTTFPVVRAFAFSPDGRWLLYSTDIELFLLDVSTGQLGAPISVATGDIRDLLWSPDNDWVAYNDVSAGGYQALQLSSGATFPLNQQPPSFVVSRWGTRVLFYRPAASSPPADQPSYTLLYADLSGVTPSTLPEPTAITTGSDLSAVWVGDQFCAITVSPVDTVATYVQFGRAGVESVINVFPSFNSLLTLSASYGSPARAVFSPNVWANPVRAPVLWIDVQSQQRIEWPDSGTPSPFAFSPSLSQVAVSVPGDAGLHILQAAQPKAPELGVAPSVSPLDPFVVQSDSQLTWSPAEDLIASTVGAQVYVTWLGADGDTQAVPSDFSDLDGPLHDFRFGARGDWLTFIGSRAGTPLRWFSAIQGKTLSVAQELPDLDLYERTEVSEPLEAPDHSAVALFARDGVRLASVSAGALGAVHHVAMLPILGPFNGGQWSSDSRHFVAAPDLSATGAGPFQLFIADAADPSATAVLLAETQPDAYRMQP